MNAATRRAPGIALTVLFGFGLAQPWCPNAETLWFAGLAAQGPQSAAGAPLAFEVASVKQNKSNAREYSQSLVPFTYVNVPLRTFVLLAYDVRDFLLSGGPDWMNTEKFDIVAKGPEGSKPSLEQTRQMVRSLLEERFKLQVRRETKVGPLYHLVLARSDGRLGQHLRPAKFDCASEQTPVSVRRDPTYCGLESEDGRVSWRGRALSSLVFSVTSQLQRPVLDRTGLTGPFDYDLRWNRNQRPDSQDPSLETALEEQLGLKLQPQHGPIETLVVEHAERPTPD